MNRWSDQVVTPPRQSATLTVVLVVILGLLQSCLVCCLDRPSSGSHPSRGISSSIP